MNKGTAIYHIISLNTTQKNTRNVDSNPKYDQDRHKNVADQTG